MHAMQILSSYGAPLVIGTPTAFTTSTGSTLGATASFGLTAGIVAGNLSVVFVYGLASATTVSAVTDSINSYTKMFRYVDTTGLGDIELWYCANCAAVTNGATGTVSVSAGGGSAYAIAGVQCSGIVASLPADVGPASVVSAFTTTPSTSTGTLAQASELIFGIVTVRGGASVLTFTPGGSFTSIVNLQSPGNSNSLAVAYQVVNSTSSVSFAPTLGISGSPSSTTISVATFK